MSKNSEKMKTKCSKTFFS